MHRIQMYTYLFSKETLKGVERPQSRLFRGINGVMVMFHEVMVMCHDDAWHCTVCHVPCAVLLAKVFMLKNLKSCKHEDKNEKKINRCNIFSLKRINKISN
jgi:hypothetical protein